MTRRGEIPFSCAHAPLCDRLGGEPTEAFRHGASRALAAVEIATFGDLTWCGSRRHLSAALRAHAEGASIVVPPALAVAFPADARIWRHACAGWVFAQLLEDARYVLPPPEIAADANIESGVLLARGVRVGAGASIGMGSALGRAGFGLVDSPEGKPYRLPHLGGVEIGAGVSIGAYCTIDAGVLLPTVLGDDCALDSHVHLGHNVTLGARVRIAAQAGLAGSVEIGDDVWIGGQAGLADHVKVGAGARIAAKAGVIGDVPAGAVYAGYPAMPRLRWLRQHARGRRP